jgi:hypothetical protein
MVEAAAGADLQDPADQAGEEDAAVLEAPWASMAGPALAKTRTKIGCRLPVDGRGSDLVMAAPSSSLPGCRRGTILPLIQVVKWSLE